MAERSGLSGNNQTTNISVQSFESNTNLKGILASKHDATTVSIFSETTNSYSNPTGSQNSKRALPNRSANAGKKPKQSNELSSKLTERMKRKIPIGQDDVSAKEPGSVQHAKVMGTQLRKSHNQTLPNKKSSNSVLAKDLSLQEGYKDKRPKIWQQKMRSTSRPVSTDFSLSSTSPAVLQNSKAKMTKIKSNSNLRHSWHGMPSSLKSSSRSGDHRSSSQAQQRQKLVRKGKSVAVSIVRKSFGNGLQ